LPLPGRRVGIIRRRLYWSVFASALILWIADPVTAAGPVKVFQRLGPVEVHGDGPNYIQAGLGAFHIRRNGSDYSLAGGMEARIGKKLLFLGPAFGFLSNTDGGFFGYGGVYSDISIGKIVTTMLLGAGGYRRGDGRDLGGTLQFREGFAVSYQFGNRSRIGIMFSHVSNAGIHDRNFGENDLLLTCSIPF
jgi:hypothetical protein